MNEGVFKDAALDAFHFHPACTWHCGFAILSNDENYPHNPQLRRACSSFTIHSRQPLTRRLTKGPRSQQPDTLTYVDVQWRWERASTGTPFSTPYHGNRKRRGHRPQLPCHLSCRFIFRMWKEARSRISQRLGRPILEAAFTALHNMFTLCGAPDDDSIGLLIYFEGMT